MTTKKDDYYLAIGKYVECCNLYGCSGIDVVSNAIACYNKFHEVHHDVDDIIEDLGIFNFLKMLIEVLQK